MTLTTANGHYLCATPDGEVVADRTEAGEWEHFELLVLFGDDRVALQTVHGTYVRCHPDEHVSASSTAINAEEIWVLLRDATGGLAFRSDAHGGFLVAEGGGGGVVRANRHYPIPREWETFTPSSTLLPVPPPTALHVEANHRYFGNAAGRVNYREISAFTLLSRLLRGEVQYVRDWLAMVVREHCTATRVFLTLDGSYWSAFKTGPHITGFWQSFDLLVQLHADAGLYMRVVCIGGLEPWGGAWDPVARRDIFVGSVRAGATQFCCDVADRLRTAPHVLAEIANEPTMIGMRDSWPAIVDIGRKMKRINPGLMLSGGEDAEGRGLVAPFDYGDSHLDRDQQIHGWNWVKRTLSENAVIDQHEDQRGKALPAAFTPMLFLAGENINMGEERHDHLGHDVESQGSVCFGVAALSRARKVGGVCFHWDGGLWTTEPTPDTLRCLRAWHEGFNAFPMLTDSQWRGQWGLARGDYWRDRWPVDGTGQGTDDPMWVERWIDGGHGAWRAVGCGPFSVVFPQPKGWDWQANLEAPAERIAINTDGVYDCAVYRRL